MRLGIASLSGVQSAIIKELMEPLASSIKLYGRNEIESGELRQSYDHAMIIDYSYEAIMEYESVLDLIGSDEPKCILSEKSLRDLEHDERLAWRKKIMAEIRQALPDLANEMDFFAAKKAECDLWVIGSSSGGPDAIATLLEALPALPISLIFVQHIGSDSGIEALKNVLNTRQNRWGIEVAKAGAALKPHTAYIVLRDSVLSVEEGRIATRELVLSNEPSPSINTNLRSLVRSFEGEISVAILSGLGDDGTAALREVGSSIKLVLTQTATDCGVSAMPNAVREAGLSHESHTATGIARRIAKEYGVGLA